MTSPQRRPGHRIRWPSVSAEKKGEKSKKMEALLGGVPRPSKAAANDRTATLPRLKRTIDWVDTFR